MNIVAKPIIDLKYTYSEWTFGDFRVILTWTLDDQRPCMVLIPNRVNLADVTPCIIKMDEAYLWSDTIVGDIRHQERSAGEFCIWMDFDPFSAGNRRRVITAIQNRLQDLLTMPPLTTDGKTAASATVLLTDRNTGEVTEIEAKTDV